MKKNKFFLFSLLVLVTALGLVMIGCNTGSGSDPGGGQQPTETWSKVTTTSQIVGTWNGTVSQQMTIENFAKAWGLNWTADDKTKYSDITVDATANAKYVVSTTQTGGKSVVTGTLVYKYTGGTTASVWSDIKTFAQNNKNSAGEPWKNGTLTFDDSKYQATFTLTSHQITYTNTELAQVGWQINNTSTKVRLPAGIAYLGAPQMELSK